MGRPRGPQLPRLPSAAQARTGRIHTPPEWDMAHGEWTWRIEGQAVDGRMVFVVFSILGEKTVKGITMETPER